MKTENVGNNEPTTEKMLGGITGKGFMPGQSGNPSGRPKRKHITEIYEELFEDGFTREEIKAAIRQRLLSSRMVGALELKEAAERLEGKIVQPIDADVTISSLAERMQKAADRAKQE